LEVPERELSGRKKYNCDVDMKSTPMAMGELRGLLAFEDILVPQILVLTTTTATTPKSSRT
jgi:hypothetical protein